MPEIGITHYSAVREGERSSKAALARSVEVEFSPEEGTGELWEKHRTGMGLLEEKGREAGRPGPDTPESSLLDLKAEIARRTLGECVLCPNRCRVDRSSRTGVCGAPEESRLSSEFLHVGEEPELVPSHTSSSADAPWTAATARTTTSRTWRAGSTPRGRRRWRRRWIGRPGTPPPT